jgi:hypothetical protein
MCYINHQMTGRKGWGLYRDTIFPCTPGRTEGDRQALPDIIRYICIQTDPVQMQNNKNKTRTQSPKIRSHHVYRKPWITSIILRQPQTREIRHSIATLKRRRIRLLRHKPILPRRAVTPLRRRLRAPRPVEPTLRSLKSRHLGFGVSLKPLFVLVRVISDIRVGVVATTCSCVGGGTVCG